MNETDLNRIDEQIDFLYDTVKSVIPVNVGILPSEWNEENRSIPPEFSSKPGRLTFDNSPFWKEVIDCLSPQNPTRELAVMKGNQLGFTQIVIEGAMGYFIDCFPQPILYVSADKELAELNMSTRIDSLLKTCDLQHKIKPSVTKKFKSKTGDTKSRKEFSGGFIAAFGAKNPDKLRQIGYPVALNDEIDTYADDLKNQGDSIELIRRRTDAFSETRKIVYGSTPLTKNSSNIEKLFKQGDQCYYQVPCPHCGKMQVLTFGHGKEGPGLKFETTENGNLIYDSVYYQCENGCKIQEVYKYEMLKKGKWVATAEPSVKGLRSFHISALYSNFFKWNGIIEAWISCTGTGDPEKMKAKLKVFINNILAETWEEPEKTISYREVMKNCRNYKPATVPNKIALKDGNGRIVMLTAGVDVNGQYDKTDGWLAFEIKGHCLNGQTYSIAKAEIHGVTDKGGNAWTALKELVEESIYTSDDGINYKINLTGVDVGFKPDAGYWFSNYCDRVVPVAGRNDKVKNDRIVFRHKVPLGTRWSVDTVHYKNMIADQVRLIWDQIPGKPQPYGFMNFPDEKHYSGLEDAEFQKRHGIVLTGAGYDNDYFKCFGSEAPQVEKDDPNEEGGKVVGWKKRNSKARTHFWDVTVYNYAVRDIYLMGIGESLKIQKPDPFGIMVKLAEYLETYNEQWGF